MTTTCSNDDVVRPCRPADTVPAPLSRSVGSGHLEALFTALYSDLCRMARREVRRIGANDILGTATLVHEAWLDIQRSQSLHFASAGQFLAYASRMMRGLVIDRVRKRHSQKRGGGLIITSLDTHTAEQAVNPEFLHELSDALDELATKEPELTQIVDLRFFCGFTLDEIASMRGVSVRTVQRQWEKARLVLYHALREDQV